MEDFDFEEERVRQEIRKFEARRVLIQLPEGLKPKALQVAKTIEEMGVLPIVSADPCYGACDLAATEAENLKVDMIIHYGHSKLMKHERIPTIYVEARAIQHVDSVIGKALRKLEKYHTIGLVTTVQHVQTLDEVREILIRAGKTVVIGDTGRLGYPGQVIGCDYTNATSVAKNAEAFLFIGGGRFHALGVALSTSKPTILADPYDMTAFSVNKDAERIRRQRWSVIKEAEKARTFAVLIGLKRGQEKMEEALHIKEKFAEHGRTTYLFAARNITPEALMNFPGVDAFINTACPRLSIDDGKTFRRPFLTINEAKVVIGESSWGELCQKGLLER